MCSTAEVNAAWTVYLSRYARHFPERGASIDEFTQGTINVLVATTLMENGVDIPNLNTLIVMDMHKFGVAALHQLRGRVGRGEAQAHAYLLHPPLEELKAKTRHRLTALKQGLALGSGWSLAITDLEMRGAGNPLGTQQKGKSGWEGVDAGEFERIVEEAMWAIEGMAKRGGRGEESDEDEESDDDDESKGEEEKRVVLTANEKTVAEAMWIKKLKSNRNFRCITMPRVALLLLLLHHSWAGQDGTQGFEPAPRTELLPRDARERSQLAAASVASMQR